MITGVLGKPRTGKTLYIVWRGYMKHKQNYEVSSNFYCEFAKRLDTYEMLQIPFTDLDRHPKILLMQEADKIFPSKRAMTNENTLLGSLTGQSGKRNLDIMWDTQFPHLVDTQIRTITEQFVTCSALEYNEKPIAFTYRVYDVYDASTNADYQPKEFTIPAKLLEPLYSMYDSYEPTKGRVTNKKMHEILGIEEEELANV